MDTDEHRMMYIREANGTIDEVGERLEAAVKAHRFGVIGMIDLKATMAKKGVEFACPCRIYEVCNPHKAKEVLESDMCISTALPCRISLYEEDGRVKLASILPSAMLGMFGADQLDAVAAEVEEAIRGIVDEAAG